MRATREGDFKLYIDAFTKIFPWFFALDHTNYARWIPVHLRDMVILKDINPKDLKEFLKGNFVVKKTAQRFSTIDQGREQSNAAMKMTEEQ